MNIFKETERLILREILPSDEAGIFELDSDPEVQRYLGNKPIRDLAEVREMISFIRQQYIDHGIGRFAVVEKETDRFVGWAGLKFMTTTVNDHEKFYDLGYRLIKKYWGRGYATESAKAWLHIGFREMNLPVIYAMADASNNASRQVLLKSGLQFVNEFDLDGTPHNWYSISFDDWKKETRHSMKFKFRSKIYKVGINPCVKVPAKITDQLEAVKGYIAVKGTINKHFFRQTLCPVKDDAYCLYVNGPMLKGSQLTVGDDANFVIEQDTQERNKKIEMPARMEKALRSKGLLKKFQQFGAVSPERSVPLYQ